MALLVSLYQSGTLVSPLPAKNSGILTNGESFGTSCTFWTGAHTSKRLSMDLAMQSNIWSGVPIKLPFLTSIFCPYPKQRLSFLPGAKIRAAPNGRAQSTIRSSYAGFFCIYCRTAQSCLEGLMPSGRTALQIQTVF